MDHFFRSQTFLLGLFLVLGHMGCATTGQNPSSGIQLLSKHAVLLELPFEAQNIPNLCGVASVEMVTRYYDKKLTEAQAAFLRKEAKENEGVSGASLKKVMEEAGYFVAVFPGTLDRGESSLYSQLDLKRPLIVMVGSGPRHYEVVTGYDPDNAMIVLLDPARGQVAVPIQNFVKTWKEANYFTLLVSLDQENGEKK
jgi:ABC-type bacteriocin/lantibiotic exporter with double-glycine peptidase domain